ncbi:hypothetical protein B0H10DRAFT_2431395 [Mycena sp. CBHHK59/15]|nr:hypothetical protein B0H10DRAFT_2431395 [Mycena sp. CBHHK59/15]
MASILTSSYLALVFSKNKSTSTDPDSGSQALAYKIQLDPTARQHTSTLPTTNMRFALPLLAIAVTLASATPAPPPTPDVTLCCPSIDNRSPRGTLIDGVLTSTELCCGFIQRRDHLLLRPNWVVGDARQLMPRIPVNLLIGAGLVLVEAE